MKTPSFFTIKLSAWLGLILVAATRPAQGDALDNRKPSQVVTNPVGYMGFQFLGVTCGNGRYVAVGEYVGDDNGIIEISDDGMHWTLCTSRDYSVLDLYKATYGNGMYVAVGWEGLGLPASNLYSSTNGVNWSSHTNFTVSNFYGVTYGDGLFVAVGDGLLPGGSTSSSINIYTSPDGINWEGEDSGAPDDDIRSILDVAAGAGSYVAVDGYQHLYTSSDGFDWGRTTNSYAGGTVSFCNGRFILSSGPGANLISTDGVTWTLLRNTRASTFGRVVYGNGLYAALAGTNVFTSTDGTNWTQHTLPVPAGATLSDIAMGNREIVVVGYVNTGGATKILPVAYVSDPFVALGLNAGSPPQLSISGLQGRSYRIDYSTGLSAGAGNWQTLTTLSLTNSPLSWTDTTATNSQRMYRAALLR